VEKEGGVENAYKLAPVWYCKVSKYFIIFLISLFALMILLIAIGTMRFELYAF